MLSERKTSPERARQDLERMTRAQLLAAGKPPQTQKSFLCWHSDDLSYQRRWDNKMYQALHPAEKIREHLGGSANMTKPFPEKPKGMHWKTYERLWWEHHEADMEQLTRMREWLDKMEKKVGSPSLRGLFGSF